MDKAEFVNNIVGFLEILRDYQASGLFSQSLYSAGCSAFSECLSECRYLRLFMRIRELILVPVWRNVTDPPVSEALYYECGEASCSFRYCQANQNPGNNGF